VCDGLCPPGEVCKADSDNEACVCVPAPCELSPFPVCDGACPPGEVCEPDPDNQACVCEPGFFKADWPNNAPSGMPDFSQDHGGWPPTLCGPTAVWDSLWWFDSEMECDRDRENGDTAESEPNDTCDQADHLGEPDPIAGTFSDPNDIDWYVLEVPHKRHRQCVVTVSTCILRQPGDADTRMSLYKYCSGTGVPSGLVAVNDNGCLPATQSEIIVALDPGRYYLMLYGVTAANTYNLSLGIDCYRMVERASDVTDDHSEYNTTRFIPNLATCMNTDDVLGVGTGHRGTLIDDMQDCIDTWLDTADLDDYFTEQTVLMPDFPTVETEIERSEDVVLLLGFYWQPQPDLWLRCGGHYVTAAGVDSENWTISFSDPALNNAEPPPVGNGALGRVRGPKHDDHAPAAIPPPDHDDAQNVSHDLYAAGPPNVFPLVSTWSVQSYATHTGGDTTCEDVARWCMGPFYGQNPLDPAQEQVDCMDPQAPVSVEVEAMVDVSPIQTPICLLQDPDEAWPNNLRVDRQPCPNPTNSLGPHDVVRGKLCNLRYDSTGTQVDLYHVQCMYDETTLDQYDDVSPDHTDCFGGWFYLVRQSSDTDYGDGTGGKPRMPQTGDCP
jgi:hypothetical protein